MESKLLLPSLSDWRVEMSTSMSSGEKKMTEPARSFKDCVKQSVISTRKMLEEGNTLIEVEFPPLPLDYLEDSASSARDIADANTRWAIEFAQGMAELGQISIIYPDQPELEAAVKFVDEPGGEKPYPNVTLATIRTDSIKNAKTLIKCFYLYLVLQLVEQ